MVPVPDLNKDALLNSKGIDSEWFWLEPFGLLAYSFEVVVLELVH